MIATLQAHTQMSQTKAVSLREIVYLPRDNISLHSLKPNYRVQDVHAI